MFDDSLMEGGAVPQTLVTQDHGRAATQRWVELLDEAVEAMGGKLQHPVAFAQVTVVRAQRYKFGQRAMTDRHALWPAGRARGVDHVGQVGRINGNVRVLRAGCRTAHLIDAQALNSRQLRQHRLLLAVGQQQFQAAVVQHMT